MLLKLFENITIFFSFFFFQKKKKNKKKEEFDDIKIVNKTHFRRKKYAKCMTLMFITR